MSIQPTEEQKELERSLRDFFTSKTPSEYLRGRIDDPAASDKALWDELVGLGLISYFASSDAENRAGAQELGIIARESGRALLGEPLIESIVGGPFLYFQILDGATRAQVDEHIGVSFRDGTQSAEKLALAVPYSFSSALELEVRNKGETIRLTGKVPFVVSAPMAHYLLIGVVLDGSADLCLVDLKTGKEQRSTSKAVSALDLTRKYYEVELLNVSALRLGAQALQGMRDVVQTATAEELAGLASSCVDRSVEYVKTRKQFGVAVGSFQAVQHRVADMYAQAESMRSLARFASWSLQHSAEQAALASGAAMRYARDHASSIVEGAIQMHGGVGFTWEFELHLYLRRAKMIETLFREGADAADERLIAAV